MNRDPELIGPCIVTKRLGPTDYRGTRVKASHHRDSITTWTKTIPWDEQLEGSENHLKAAEALVESWPFEALKVLGRGHDHNHYYFIASN